MFREEGKERLLRELGVKDQGGEEGEGGVVSEGKVFGDDRKVELLVGENERLKMEV